MRCRPRRRLDPDAAAASTDSATTPVVTPSVFTPNANCTGKGAFPGDVVIACGFSPSIAVLGATAEYVVVMTSPDSSGWKIYRINRASTKIDELAKGDGTVYGLENFAFSAAAKTVLHHDNVNGGGGFSVGLREIDIASGAKTLLRDYGVSKALLSTATHAYFTGDNQDSGFKRIARNGGVVEHVASTYGDPVRTLNGLFYFTQSTASGRISARYRRVRPRAREPSPHPEDGSRGSGPRRTWLPPHLHR